MNKEFIVISRTHISGLKQNVTFNTSDYKLIKRKEIQSMQKSHMNKTSYLGQTITV